MAAVKPAAALFGLLALPAAAQEGTPTPGMLQEYRGLSVRALEVWVSGRGGSWGRSLDGGRTWNGGFVPGADSLVLVDIEALHGANACVLATSFDGGLARAYWTDDGGRIWWRVYERRHPDVFLDGMAFWDQQRGVAFGDPVDGAFHVLRTDNGCRSWTEVPADALPPPLPGEAGFAASGTAIAAAGDRHAWIGTGGGAVARVLRTTDGGRTWTAHETPLVAGTAAGIFGIAFRDTLHGVAVGGNYQSPADSGANVLVTSDGGMTWTLVGQSAPAGVRYGVRYALTEGGPVVAAVGPTGFGYSRDDGASWVAVDTLNAFTVAVTARAAWVAGPKGRVVRFDPAPWMR
jgi:photosystem II stability/assembly factor-like uncharacterized protein